MKKIVLIAIAFISLNAYAQHQGPMHKKGHKGNQERSELNLSPEEVASLKTKKMTLHLDLTEVQQKQVNNLLLKQEQLHKAKMDARPKNDDGSFVKPSKDEHLTMMNERLDAKIEMKRQMKSILNKDQFEKYNEDIGKRSRIKKNKESRERRRPRRD